MYKIISLIVLITLGLPIGSDHGSPQAPEIVTVKAPDQVVIKLGGSVETTIEVTVKKGYHVQANPVRDENLIPTHLEMKPDKGVIPDRPIYPAGKSFRLKGTSEDLSTYDGTFVIRLAIKVLASAQPGDRLLEGKLHYQACDSLQCLFPRSVSVTIPVKVTKGIPLKGTKRKKGK